MGMLCARSHHTNRLCPLTGRFIMHRHFPRDSRFAAGKYLFQPVRDAGMPCGATGRGLPSVQNLSIESVHENIKIGAQSARQLILAAALHKMQTPCQRVACLFDAGCIFLERRSHRPRRKSNSHHAACAQYALLLLAQALNFQLDHLRQPFGHLGFHLLEAAHGQPPRSTIRSFPNQKTPRDEMFEDRNGEERVPL